MPETRSPDVDLVIAFTATKRPNLSKQQTREEVRKAELQYSRLINTLSYAGLKAVGRRGESLGHLLVFVRCPPKRVKELVKKERQSDFLSGLPVRPVSTAHPLSPADRIRLVYTYIASSPKDGGLGVSPDSPEWDLVESIFPLQDKQFNEAWVRAWTPRNFLSVQLESIRSQFGDSLAYYFAFLACYTRFLVGPAVLGIVAYYFLPPYSPIYSILLCLWSITFVEWWRIHERILSLRFGTRGSFKVEKRRAQHKPGMRWWVRELRVLSSVPVILLFAGILSAILTGIFIFEAFVTHLYQGPGKKIITFTPTLFFVVLVPRVLAVYQAIAVKLTNWENHRHKSTYAASLTLKTFALSAIVAYLGLGLSAFVYVPFGEGVMHWVQAWLFNQASTAKGFSATLRDMLNGTVITAGKDSSVVIDSLTGATEKPLSVLWDTDRLNIRTKLNPGRLRDQMFAYTVTNQAVNTFVEVGLPFILRYIDGFRKRKAKSAPPPGSPDNGVKKRVVFEDEKEQGGLEERIFLDSVREEAGLPEYEIFIDYNEMVVQFGYVVLWSTIWPLAGVMAFLNNLLEIRSDAFKMTVHNRRPLPSRTDTIGPWLDALTFLTWLGALTNSALVYLFSPQLLPNLPSAFFTSNNVTVESVGPLSNNATLVMEEHLVSAAGSLPNAGWGLDGSSNSATMAATKELLLKAILVSLVASHGFLILRSLIRHVVQKIFWKGSEEVDEREREEREVKEKFLSGSTIDLGSSNILIPDDDDDVVEDETEHDSMRFWDHDEGVEEIRRISKEA